ncbi:MAG: SPOR domain-containing protein [Deltaproteobacteria bacterium]|nr:SPOR domain-containing protein [Deltaproteobacteria bacterium]
MANHRKATVRGSVYFSRGQLFGVASLFVGAAAVIFFFGILIGQSIEERKLVRKGDAGVTVPVNPAAPGDDQEMTFYETLTQQPPPKAGVPAAQTPPADDGKTPWTVQVAAADTRARADRMAAELKKRGYDSYVTSGQLNRKTFYRVRVGRYRSRQEAMVELQRLKKDKYDPMIMGTQ